MLSFNGASIVCDIISSSDRRRPDRSSDRGSRHPYTVAVRFRGAPGPAERVSQPLEVSAGTRVPGEVMSGRGEKLRHEVDVSWAPSADPSVRDIGRSHSAGSRGFTKHPAFMRVASASTQGSL